MSGENRKCKQKATPKVRKAKKMLTLKQARFAVALMKARTKREAAITAGYSRKNIDQSANQARALGHCLVGSGTVIFDDDEKFAEHGRHTRG